MKEKIKVKDNKWKIQRYNVVVIWHPYTFKVRVLNKTLDYSSLQRFWCVKFQNYIKKLNFLHSSAFGGLEHQNIWPFMCAHYNNI